MGWVQWEQIFLDINNNSSNNHLALAKWILIPSKLEWLALTTWQEVKWIQGLEVLKCMVEVCRVECLEEWWEDIINFKLDTIQWWDQEVSLELISLCHNTSSHRCKWVWIQEWVLKWEVCLIWWECNNHSSSSRCNSNNNSISKCLIINLWQAKHSRITNSKLIQLQTTRTNLSFGEEKYKRIPYEKS